MGASIVDQPAADRRVALLEKSLDRDVDLLGGTEEALAVGGRELEGLDVAMEEVESPRPHPRDVIAFEQVQRHRDERALRPRTARVHVDAAVRRLHWGVDAHALRAKIFPGHRATGPAHAGRDLFGYVPLVDGVARGQDRVRAPLALVRPLDRRESTEERAEIPLDEDLPHPRRPSVR